VSLIQIKVASLGVCLQEGEQKGVAGLELRDGNNGITGRKVGEVMYWLSFRMKLSLNRLILVVTFENQRRIITKLGWNYVMRGPLGRLFIGQVSRCRVEYIF
jgi:hypothetical protein